MGESVAQSENSTKKQKKNRKHKLRDEPKPESETPEAGEPATKLRKPQAPMKKSRKKLKQEERQQKEREEIFDKYKASAATYLQSWQNDKVNWKFSKNVQNWIVAHLYDSKLLPDSLWPIVLEYFAGSKGAAKLNLIETATKIIEEDNNESTEDDTEAVNKSRANDIIQFIVK